ncbi:hypothetical protein EOS_03825 [Caballeronia mineralivorans PML1(12)]|uniref:Uncharacterized protein n=1 Tax=Caballeronia mineralivorans PML1(12) TaxID=908627 RepID=A0A0J1D4D5_9BURK|nr:hypothetical protein [Caballeronia mineralivorans]KLU27531.1 hypothetical protein EOS_03825 [Caballeronia mineralivorans PML1(12)]
MSSLSSSLPVTFSRPPPLLSARPAEATADANSAPAVALLTDTVREMLNAKSRNVCVVEDPAEISLAGINQARSATFHCMWCSLSP